MHRRPTFPTWSSTWANREQSAAAEHALPDADRPTNPGGGGEAPEKDLLAKRRDNRAREKLESAKTNRLPGRWQGLLGVTGKIASSISETGTVRRR